jgi:hypothetical protein
MFYIFILIHLSYSYSHYSSQQCGVSTLNSDSNNMIKKLHFFVFLFTCVSSTLLADIPNPGFEDWTDMTTYMTPNGWATTNGISGSFFAATRDTDHYPADAGSYSVRLENNPAGLVDYSGLGIVMPDTL